MIERIILVSIIMTLITAAMIFVIVRSTNKPHPKTDFVKKEIARIFSTMDERQLQAVTIWAWAAKDGWDAPIEDIALHPEKYPHLEATIRDAGGA
jgi:hypothetical protein